MKNRKYFVFFLIAIALAIVICITTFCYWEIINPLRDDPYYDEPLPDDLFY